MDQIKRLPPELANQIAAGEVVERPASAVKELVENALDAGARRIAVAIEFGGKRLIRVEDDGIGMSVEDAALALERHATSKLETLEDLGAIATLGFRGEALPSIASVSRLTLRTRPRGLSTGTEITVDSGVTTATGQVGMPEGTAIEVVDLFHNVPARRKFLKSDAAEAAQVTRVVTQLSMGYPDVGFSLTSRGRQVLQCPPVETLQERFFQLHGDRPDLVEVRKEAAGVRVSGYAAALVDQGPSRGPQTVLVNRRVVRDRTITHAIHEAYRQAALKPRTPEVHLFIELPADRVDVNVHPMKAEVRFFDQSLVHELLRRALADALGQPSSASFRSQPAPAVTAEPVLRSIPGIVSSASVPSRWSAGAEASVARQPDAGSSGVSWAPADERSPLIPLGQFRDTFIVAIDNDGIVIIDQHVAHERVLFEQVMTRLTEGALEAQRLLTPIVLDLQPAQRGGLAARATDLQRLAFEIDAFGGDSVQVTAVPALLDRQESERAVRALASDLERLDAGTGVDEVLRRLAATTACHAAVKAHDRLTPEKMQYILAELRRTEYSTVCPHGRPIALRLTREEIERSFQRI